MPISRSKSFLPELKKTLRVLEKGHVIVGIAGSDAAAKHEGSDINMAALGYIFEYGAPEINMPARPWLVPGVEAAREQIAKALAAGAAKALAGGGPAAAEAALMKAGLIAQSAVQERITSGIAPSLSERTVYARMHRKKNRRKGGGQMTPLIDTGDFIKRIRYVIEM